MSGKSGQILSLNAVRGLAAFIVILSHLPEQTGFHFGPVHEGSLGVMIFFTLSGFLMGLLYLHKPADAHEVPRYAIARFSRIAPPYLMVVLASALIFTFLDPKFPYAVGHGNFLRHLLFSGNVSVFWSIPPEVQFYVLFIGAWWALQRAYTGRTGALIVVVALAVAAICLRDKVPGTFAISKLHYFLMGALLGGLHPLLRKVPISTKALTVLQVSLLAAFGLFLLEVIHLPKNYWNDLAPALIAGLVVFAFAHDRTPIDAVFSAKPLQWLGDWSFSIYLVHVPVIYVLVRFGLMDSTQAVFLGVLFTLAVCAAFSKFIELPACALTKRHLTALLVRWEKRRASPPKAAPESAFHDITTDRTSP